MYVRKRELSFKRKMVRHLSAASNIGKRNWHVMKGWHIKICWKNRTRTYTHYPHVFSNFSIFPFFIKRRRFIVAICFSFLLTTPTCWNFEMSKTSLCPNTSLIQYMSEIHVSLLPVFFLGSFEGFFWISYFVFTL